jgi:hypothetical protein
MYFRATGKIDRYETHYISCAFSERDYHCKGVRRKRTEPAVRNVCARPKVGVTLAIHGADSEP